ncbi:MAG: ABC transporter ATP-binding protein/permease [Sandaracinaceae bacterium]|nr:ABC transporter ATP-binding protein/permease [Sandaracinaceae bacterium]
MPHRRALSLGILWLLLTQAAEKAIPWIFREGIDALLAGDLDAVSHAALWVIVLALGAWAVRTASRILIFNVGRDVEFDLRNALLAKLHQLGPSFFRTLSTGEIMSRATNDLTQVRLLVGFGALNLVNSTLAFASAIALMVVVSPRLTMLALLPYPLLALSAMGFSRAMFKRSNQAQGALAKLAERVQEDVAGVRVVRSLGLEARQAERFEQANAEAVEHNLALVAIRGLMFPVLMGFSSIGTLIVIYQGGLMVLEGSMTVGELAAFNAYLAQLVWPTLALGYLLAVITRGRASYGRVADVLVRTPLVVEAPDARPAPDGGALHVAGLSYTIEGREILSDVSFDVPAGGSLAIVGATGSGKSTVAALLARLLPTPEGAVFLDGLDITTLTLRSLRHTVGYAQQEPFLFSTTVERNLELALARSLDPSSDDAAARLRAAADEAAVLEEIQGMPEGFQTIVGERGVQLSGGQKQRLALARALLDAPRVLVLDDPLSAVDARTEERILAAIDRAAEGRTLVLVTHRIAAARRADRTLVLDKGRVVESGTHDELVALGGHYAKLAERQRLERELDGDEAAAPVGSPPLEARA